MHKFFPPSVNPYPEQLKALAAIETAFSSGKRFFVLEGPTGFGKSAVAKAALTYYGKGFITSPLNILVTQYSQDPALDLTEVRGQSTYTCRAFHNFNCEKAGHIFEDHSDRCLDYIPARYAFWTAAHSVTNLHFLYYAPPIDEALYPRDVLVVDEAHNLEETLIAMGRRTISPKIVSAIKARLFDFPGEDRKLLNVLQVRDWLKYFENAIAYAQGSLADEKEKRDYESLREAINFTLECGDWIAWKERGNLVIAPLSGTSAARRLFRCATRIVSMSATMGDIPLFLKNLGIRESDAAIHKAPCGFAPENRKIVFNNLGSMSKSKGQPGLMPMLNECARIIRERPGERGIIHCHSRELQQIVFQHLQREFGNRILSHSSGNDRNAAVSRLRSSSNGPMRRGYD